MNAFGSITLFGETMSAITDPLTDLIEKIPLFGTTLSNAIAKILELVPTLQTGTTGGTTSQSDALIMNDGIIKFHQDDKFMRVNDTTMIAGTNVDGNRQLARAITGGSSANIDYTKLASAIASALQNVNLTVKIDRDIYAPSTLNPIGRRI